MFSRKYKKSWLLLICVVTLGYCLKLYITTRTSEILEDVSFVPTLTNGVNMESSCVRPVNAPWPPHFQRLFRTATPPKCLKEENWIYTTGSSILISKAAQEAHGEIVCHGRPIRRGGDDFTVGYGDRFKLISEKTPLTSDFLEVKCVAKDGTKYENIHAGIRLDSKLGVTKIAAGDNNPLGFNIFIFAFDSVSRMMWIRDLPKTYKYLVDVLGASVLEGYNIVGGGTLPNMLPILTGKSETEIPESLRERKNATTADKQPWIWKELKKLGYVTQYGEDMSHIGAFTLRMMGFKSQPTDHYMRPFYLTAKKRYKNESAFCLGSLPRLRVLLNWGKEFYQTYPKQSKFSLLFHKEYSHGHINRLNWGDDDVFELLDFLNTKGHLINTLLIVMSDHGQRAHEIRWTLQGKYEERMPFFSIRLPPSFQNLHPDAMTNLRVNTQRLTTPFDIYATLRDIINFTGAGVGDLGNRGISLFKEIPMERTCADARIEPHWCACLNWVDVSTTNRSIQGAANYVVTLINSATMKYREQCAELSLLNVSSATQFFANDRMLQFNGITDETNRKPVFRQNATEVSEQLYQVTLSTKPNFGIFEATVKYLFEQGSFVGSINAISRLDRYGNQPHCIMEKMPNLRPYCYCHIQQSKQNDEDIS